MIKVRVPASTSNIGPGFDSLGLALNLYNEYSFQEIEEGLSISGFPDEFANENNLVYTSMLETFKYMDYKPKGIKIIANTEIPVSRGLGSSGTCIIGGVLGANEIAGNILSKEEIFKLATSIEGHPDNIAPSLFGGFVISAMEEGRPIANNFSIAKGIKFVALIPDFTLSTEEARGVLPKEVVYKDAVENIARVSLLLSALNNGNFDLLKYALKDRLHEPYRGHLINNFSEIKEKVKGLGAYGVFLSGAGPTIMSIVDENDNNFVRKIKTELEDFEDNWSVVELAIDKKGSQIIE